MSSTKHRVNAFTLIELLTIIAIIAILSSILIPVAGGVIKQAQIAAYKAKLWQYITALEQFKAEYNYYPSIHDTNGLIDLSGTAKSEQLVESLSGRNHSTGNPEVEGGNYHAIQFYSFAEQDFFDHGGGNYSSNRLADPFNNTGIFILLDIDGDGNIRPYSSDPVSPGKIKGNATAWVVANNGKPGYALWE